MSKYFGISTCIDLEHCNKKIITSSERIQEYIDSLCELIEMKKFGDSHIVNFGNENVAGYSFTQMIETSLISGHLCDRNCTAYIDIFSCKYYPSRQAAMFSEKFFEGLLKDITINYRW